jgi:glutathione S-transferase
MSAGAPLLWQYTFSNYNEKARWALDYKALPHRRRSLMPGEPRAMAFSLRGTLPVLDLDHRRFGDSTAIIAELERLQPEPPLYPADAEQRRQALAFEDDFDEEVGHALRRALFWEVRDDRDYMIEFLTKGQPARMRAVMRASFPVAWAYVCRRYSFNQAGADAAWGTLERALDRIEAQRQGRPHLIGESFSVADLTAAALLWPLAWPPEYPYELPRFPERPRLERLRRHPATTWIAATYASHRPRSAEID